LCQKWDSNPRTLSDTRRLSIDLHLQARGTSLESGALDHSAILTTAKEVKLQRREHQLSYVSETLAVVYLQFESFKILDQTVVVIIAIVVHQEAEGMFVSLEIFSSKTYGT
jgi:hypothetical protein